MYRFLFLIAGFYFSCNRNFRMLHMQDRSSLEAGNRTITAAFEVTWSASFTTSNSSL